MAKIKNRNRIKNNRFIDSALVNDATYFDYLERFKKIALSMFEWVNLPSSMNAMFLEKCLYYTGSAALLYDESNGGYINTRVCDRGRLNIYDLPTELNCYSFGYQSIRSNYVGLIYDLDDNLINDKNKEVLGINQNELDELSNLIGDDTKGLNYNIEEDSIQITRDTINKAD